MRTGFSIHSLRGYGSRSTGFLGLLGRGHPALPGPSCHPTDRTRTGAEGCCPSTSPILSISHSATSWSWLGATTACIKQPPGLGPTGRIRERVDKGQARRTDRSPRGTTITHTTQSYTTKTVCETNTRETTQEKFQKKKKNKTFEQKKNQRPNDSRLPRWKAK